MAQTLVCVEMRSDMGLFFSSLLAFQGQLLSCFEMALVAGRLAVLIACLLAWSSASCAALCTREVASGKTSGGPPCHHHNPGRRPAGSCGDQQFPQFDVPQDSSGLTACTRTVPVDVVVPPLQTALRDENASAFLFRILKPPGGTGRSVVVLRI